MVYWHLSHTPGGILAPLTYPGGVGFPYPGGVGLPYPGGVLSARFSQEYGHSLGVSLRVGSRYSLGCLRTIRSTPAVIDRFDENVPVTGAGTWGNEQC